ncbi:MAG: DNA translocase FtsK 4TM domain-containing protein [Deltaproteobacteria bacterium]|nr:DNA translocase FtsK 4TM domain-containing protein [Deltaproteobacteria bacterium]
MAKAAAKGKRKRAASVEGPSWLATIGGEFVGLGLLAFAAIGLLALGSYSSADPIFELLPVANRAGVVGASLAGGLVGLLGGGAVIFVASFAFLGGSLVLGRGVPPLASRFWVGSVLLIVSIATLPPLLDSVAPGRLGSPVGGLLGDQLASIQELLLSSWGALLVNALLLSLGLLSVTGISTGHALGVVGRGLATAGGFVAMAAIAGWESFAGFAATVSDRVRSGLMALRRSASSLQVWRERRARRDRVAELRGPELPDEPEPLPEEAPPEVAREEPAPRRGKKGAEPDIVDHEEERTRTRKPEQEAFTFKDDGPTGPFVLPDSSIFIDPPPGNRNFDRDSLLMNSRILEKKLSDFGVSGRVVRVHPGPVITMYEYEPAAGIKVNKIVGLTDDLAMALRAISIRIIAPLPGKSVVGIEVPNAQRETVYLRSILESDSFRKNDSPISVAMGMDIFGNPTTADLSTMPHLLVAGSTGTGKSVFLNSFLCSLLCRATPDELKLLLVDPKLLELSIYEGIPHLIADVVTNPKRAAAALQGIVRKMEERYLMMSSVQVRNVAQFNEKCEEEIEKGNTHFQLKPKPGEEEGQEIEWVKMPYIVVVIDELADLMVMVAKDVEESLQRLAQMARAAGIHLVLATQRPSVDVLTGVIKANFPSRVSFQVSSAIDSRTILDQKGAENLLGMGDMLFLPPRTSVLARLHAPFVSEKEVAELVSYLRDQGKPVFDEELVKFTELNAEGMDGSSAGGEDVDEMFDQAVSIVSETRNASISYVQRRLKIGYNRAARIIEHMERDGMVGPQVGTRPREVFLRDPNADEE